MPTSCIVGIDLGGTNAQGIAAAVADGRIIKQGRIPTRVALGPEQVLDNLAQLALDLADGQRIAALGIGVPGSLNLETGECVFAGNLNWHHVAVGPHLSRRLSAPVLMDNDVRVAALGELTRGKAQNCRDFIYITVGTGIGSGIFIDGKLLRGPRWSAGEVGHMILLEGGPKCTCGSQGCLEALAAAPAIAREARLAARAHPSSLLNKLCNGDRDKIDAAMVSEAVDLGDLPATAVFERAMAWLGLGVTNLVNIFNPSLVVIGGGVSLAGQKLLDAVSAQVQTLAMPVQREHVSLTTSGLADGAGAWGALALAREYLRGDGTNAN